MTLRGAPQRRGLGIELFEQVGEVGPGELPFERCGDALVVTLEAEEALLDVLKRGEVVGSESFALDNREVDLDLVEPTGVDRAVDGDQRGVGRLERRALRDARSRCP